MRHDLTVSAQASLRLTIFMLQPLKCYRCVPPCLIWASSILNLLPVKDCVGTVLINLRSLNYFPMPSVLFFTTLDGSQMTVI